VIKAIIVDDEAPARSELRYLLETAGGVDVIAEAGSVREALEQLKTLGADVMFLDINMPDTVGLQLAEALTRLKAPPAVVFVTAYSEHAAKAFDVNALDYLIKPVQTERLSQTLAKIQQHLQAQNKQREGKRIQVEKGGRRILISTTNIHYIMARDDYSYVYADSDRYLSTYSLTQFETMLADYGFFRVHRRYLVSLESVQELIPVSGGGLQLRLAGEDELMPVSRRRVVALKRALGL
jgi:two-component system response regulator LytT